jgi:putative ABC transport system permease protein
MNLTTLQHLSSMNGKATLLVASRECTEMTFKGWNFKSVGLLTKETTDMVKAKSKSTGVMDFVFLFLALIAIFDTQTLSVFRRQKEIGTFAALGMTQRQVIGMFTLEGTMNAFLALLVGSSYGVPLCWYAASVGIPLNMDSSQFGMVVVDRMYPVFDVHALISTVAFIILCTAIVSCIPAIKISKMKPTEAIKGKS